MDREKGFTLVELMIVVALLGILAAVAVPLYRGYISNARTTEAKTNLETLRLLEEQYFAEKGEYVSGTSTTDLADNIFPRGFRPGNISNLYYDYNVVAVMNNTTNTWYFTASALGKETAYGNYWINEKNDRNW